MSEVNRFAKILGVNQEGVGSRPLEICGGMGSDGDRVLRSVEAAFDARLEREERIAIADLAFSFEQDRPLVDFLTRAGSVRAALPGGLEFPVTTIGLDYVGFEAPTGVIPLSACQLLIDESGNPPKRLDQRLLEVLRTWARARRAVRVVTGSSEQRGALIRAARDHIALGHGEIQVLIGSDSIRAVTLESHGG